MQDCKDEDVCYRAGAAVDLDDIKDWRKLVYFSQHQALSDAVVTELCMPFPDMQALDLRACVYIKAAFIVN